MKLSISNYLLFLGLITICLAAICLADNQGDNEAAATSTSGLESARAKFTLPKLFDFERYKTLFKKRYNSLVEEVARAKLFLGRAFRAFVSAISYKHRRVNFYLAINQMSDWTPEEVRRIRLRRDGSFPEVFGSLKRAESDEESLKEDGVVPATSLDAVQQELEEIVHDGEQQPNDIRRLIAQELSKQDSHRRRRSASSPREQFSLNDIDRAPVEAAEEVGQRVESNNPQYEPPEQTSYGTSSDAPAEELSARAGALIGCLPGGGYVGWVLSKATDLLWPIEEEEEAKVKFEDADDSPFDTRSELADKLFSDHRDECMFAPRDQGRCGSCYAFAAISVYEWFYCKATGKKVAFSEQYIVDCGDSFGLEGCEGGWTHKIPKFVRRRGLELRANYPYRARTDQCPYDGKTPDSATGYLHVSMDSSYYVDYKKFEKELKKAPLLITLLLGDSFSEYGGGVDDGSDCGLAGAHAVALVGSGREDDQEYWLIRNSYSAVFGEAGYYKLNKKAKKCIEHQQAYVFAGFKVGRDEGLNSRYKPDAVERRYHEYVSSDVANQRRSIKQVFWA